MFFKHANKSKKEIKYKNYNGLYSILHICIILNEIWGKACNLFLDHLAKLQKIYVRILTFSDYNSAQVFINFKILPLTIIGMQIHTYYHKEKPLVIKELVRYLSFYILLDIAKTYP